MMMSSPIPNTQKSSLTVEQKFKAISEEMNRLKAIRKVKAEAFADRLGVKKSSIYALLSGKLVRKDGKRNFSDVAISKFYNELVGKAKPCETSSFQFLSNLVNGAQAQGLMMSVSGKTGVGKSTALKYITDSRENTHYVLCDHFDSPEVFITRIFNAFGLNLTETEAKARGKKRRKLMIESVAEYVLKQEQNPLLILDDIHHLSLAAYQDMKVLFDYTEGALGMLLVGTPLLEQKLKKLAGYDMNWNLRYTPRAIMPEFVRRFKGNFYQVPAIQREDLELLSINAGVEAKEAKAIAKHFVKLPHLELGMFSDKLEKAQQMTKGSELGITLELMQML